MAIPQMVSDDLLRVLHFIDEIGIPDQEQNDMYDLVTEEGKRYPAKYVIAVAAHIVNGMDIVTEGYHTAKVNHFLQNAGFQIKSKKETYKLIVIAEQIASDDVSFTVDNLFFGDNYKQQSNHGSYCLSDV